MNDLKDFLLLIGGWARMIGSVILGAWGGCAVGAKTYTGPVTSGVSPLDNAKVGAAIGVILVVGLWVLIFWSRRRFG